MTKECALMGCELPDDWPNLQSLILESDENSKVHYVANLLVEEHGFKMTDCLCLDCFWK